MKRNQDTKVITVAALAEHLSARLTGDGSMQVTAVNSLEQAGPAEVSFLIYRQHIDRLVDSAAAAVIVAEKTDKTKIPQLLVKNVHVSLIQALNLFAPRLTPCSGLHTAAVIEQTAVIGDNVAIGPGVYIGHGANIAENCIIAPGCRIGENTSIDRNCRLDGNVVIYHNCKIGKNCIIQANSTIGSVGFGYYLIDGKHELIPHNGSVIIEDCVEIGANCCVDRAKFGNTVIGAGTKIDNLVQIAHNVRIGKCCLVAGQVGIAGSSRLGDGVVLGGQAGVGDHLKIGDGAMVGGGSAVIGNVPSGKQVWGAPAYDTKEQLRNIGLVKRLPKIVEQLREVVDKVQKLEAAKNDKQ